MQKKAFTLIEMLIVITIVGILTSITMKLGGNYVRDVQARQFREEWISDFNTVRGKLLLSRHHKGVNAEKVTISFEKNTMTQTITEEGKEETITKAETYEHMKIKGPPVTIRPYKLNCQIGKEEEIKLTFVPHSTLEYCYVVDTSTCKLISKICPSQTK